MKTKLSIFRAVQSGRFFALVTLVALGLLSAASGAKAGGCAVPSKTGTASPIPFVSPHRADDQDGDKPNKPGAIVGLWHVNYTAETESGAPIFLQFPSRSPKPIRCGTRMELNLKTQSSRPRVETSATASGRRQATAWSSCTTSVSCSIPPATFQTSSPTTRKLKLPPTAKPTQVPSISSSGRPASTPSASEPRSRRPQDQ